MVPFASENAGPSPPHGNLTAHPGMDTAQFSSLSGGKGSTLSRV